MERIETEQKTADQAALALADLELGASASKLASTNQRDPRLQVGPSSPGDGTPRGRGRGRGVDFPLRVLVSSDMVGAIIGRGGATIRNITQQSRARVDVHSYRKLEHSPSLEKAITVYGQPENCTAACKRILEVMEEEARNVGKQTEISLKILAHNNLIGRIIGKQGATIKKIMEDTDTKITVSSISDISSFNLERVITIKGTIPDIARAEAEVSTKLRAAYETDLAAMAPQSVMFPGLHPTAMMSTVGLRSLHPAADTAVAASQAYSSRGPGVGGGLGLGGGQGGAGGLQGQGQGVRQQLSQQVLQETAYLYIPNAAVGAIIGTKGSHIRNIIKFSGSSVKIASADDEPESGRSVSPPVGGVGGVGAQAVALSHQEGEAVRRVTIVGAPEAQWKAQYLIFEKLREEGFSSGLEDVRLTVEIMVPSAQVGRIIGKGGQNVREIQRLTGAVIKLPEQGTSTGEETSVHIIGPFYSTQSAQRKIRSMVTGPPSILPVLPNGSHPSSSSSQQEPGLSPTPPAGT